MNVENNNTEKYDRELDDIVQAIAEVEEDIK